MFINRITHYGTRRLEDFDKHEALRLAEELVSVTKTTSDTKTVSYDIIATTLRERSMYRENSLKLPS